MNKFVFVACIFVIAACTAEERPRSEEFIKIMDQCKIETGASDDDVKVLMMRKAMTSKNGWCLAACIKKKNGVMDANNKIDMTKVKEQFAALKTENADMYNKIIPIMQECKEKLDADPKSLADPCTAIQAYGTCFFTKRDAAGIV